MSAFEIAGWESSSLCSALQKLNALEGLMCTDTDRLCLEAGFATLDAMKSVACAIPSSPFGLYGWAPVSDAACLRRPEMKSAHSLRLHFGSWGLVSQPNTVTEPYNWDGFTLSHSVQVTRRVGGVTTSEDRKPNPDLVLKLGEMAKAHCSQGSRVTTSTAYHGDSREHAYTVHLVPESALAFVQSTVEELDLVGGVGSFEFLGKSDDLVSLCDTGRYSLEKFPEHCWSFNTPPGSTPFAVGVGSALRPVLNVRAEELIKAAAVMDALSSHIVRCYVTRRFVSWRLSSSEVSARAKGNFFRISKERSHYRMYVGCDEQEGAGSELAAFTATMSSAVARLNGTLKPLSTPV